MTEVRFAFLEIHGIPKFCSFTGSFERQYCLNFDVENVLIELNCDMHFVVVIIIMIIRFVLFRFSYGISSIAIRWKALRRLPAA